MSLPWGLNNMLLFFFFNYQNQNLFFGFESRSVWLVTLNWDAEDCLFPPFLLHFHFLQSLFSSFPCFLFLCVLSPCSSCLISLPPACFPPSFFPSLLPPISPTPSQPSLFLFHANTPTLFFPSLCPFFFLCSPVSHQELIQGQYVFSNDHW